MTSPCSEEQLQQRSGVVIRTSGNTYLVRDEEGNDMHCRVKGNFRLKGIRSTSPVVVGDSVSVDLNADGTAFITAIADRKNYIVRRASNLSKESHILAANIDRAILCITLRAPETTTVFIDRFLATAEAYSVPVTLLFNKIDLYDEEDLEYLQGMIHLYSTIGYHCVQSSMIAGKGKEELLALTKGLIVLLAGHSGVGKSTIVNTLSGREVQKVGEISGYHQKGMHTTTASEMIELPHGGFLIDTPGIKGFGTVDMSAAEVSHYFPEIFRASKHCHYNNCFHLEEPDCAVRKAVSEYTISESRYNSYLNMMEDVSEGKYR